MTNSYAGFWLRFVAWILDGLILGLAHWIILKPILGLVGIASSLPFSTTYQHDNTFVRAFYGAFVPTLGIAWFLNGIAVLLYHSFMESSKYKGSLGKLILGLEVTDMAGQKLDFGKALIRNLCKIISHVTMGIGYIIAGFTEKKQALHDIIASTLVVKKERMAASQST